jgi:hypothetical protein
MKIVGGANASDMFRTASTATGLPYYFHKSDIHWNSDGHKLIADFLIQNIDLK